MQIAKGSTAFDVMAAAADQDKDFNFQATYYGNSGYMIDAIGDDSAVSGSSYWSFSYKNSKKSEITYSSFGVSSVAIPGEGWTIYMSLTSLTCKLKQLNHKHFLGVLLLILLLLFNVYIMCMETIISNVSWAVATGQEILDVESRASFTQGS